LSNLSVTTSTKNNAKLPKTVKSQTPSESKYRRSQSEHDALNDLIVDAMQDIKAKGIMKFDMRTLHDAPTDFFVLCSGESNVQVRAIADNIYRRVKETLHITPSHLEGGLQSTWVVMDYFDTVVHIFYKETRNFYELESLWGDAATTTYEDL
jgi:ribosome-associated protein